MQAQADRLQAALEGQHPGTNEWLGTTANPYLWPDLSKIPFSEFTSAGYMTLAFPTLFPLGLGNFTNERRAQ
eukprot:4489542-Pleurochrysis_carterae.AAC.1